MELAIAAGVSALVLTGCSSEATPSEASPSSPPSVATSVSAGSSAAAAPAAGTAAGNTRQPGTAVNLTLSEALRSQLGDLYYKATKSSEAMNRDKDPYLVTRDKVLGPKQVRYGKIVGATPDKDVYNAIGDTGYTDDPVSQQGGPHVWRKRGTAGWEYVGEGGLDTCRNRVPEKLFKVWGLPCALIVNR